MDSLPSMREISNLDTVDPCLAELKRLGHPHQVGHRTCPHFARTSCWCWPMAGFSLLGGSFRLHTIGRYANAGHRKPGNALLLYVIYSVSQKWLWPLLPTSDRFCP